jgi:hypothetical protein
MELSEREAYVFGLLANGWTATHTLAREFRINNGPPEDFAIIERLRDAGLVVPSSARAYVAAFCPWPYQRSPTLNAPPS